METVKRKHKYNPQRTSIGIDNELHTQIKMIASSKRKELRHFVMDILRDYIKKYQGEFNSEKPDDNKNFFNNLIFGKENFEVKAV